MKDICKARYEAFGCAGQAARIKVISMERMAERVQEGRTQRDHQLTMKLSNELPHHI